LETKRKSESLHLRFRSGFGTFHLSFLFLSSYDEQATRQAGCKFIPDI